MNTQSFKWTLLAVAITPASLLTTSLASGQGNQTQVEEIVVSSLRRAYRGDFLALESPTVDLSIDAQALRDAGAFDLSQALDLSSSVARQNNFGGLWNAFAVRGFVGDENLPSNYLVNGFNAGRGFAGPRDISGIESVEVLKGPRAALFGRGEPGGTINLVTKKPLAVNAVEVNFAADRFDQRRVDVDWNQVLGDNVGLRLVGFGERADSFRDTVESERYGATPSLAVNLGERTRLLYELEFSRQEIPFDRGIVAIDGDIDALPVERFLGEPGDGPMDARATGHQLEVQHDLNEQWNLLLGFNYRQTSLDGFSTEPELAGSRQQLFRDGRTLTRQRRSRDYDADYYVFRAELAGEFELGGLLHRVIVGADVDEFENDQVFLRARAPSLASNPSLVQLQAIDVFAPRYGQYQLPTPGPLTDRVETQEATGVYLQDQISITPNLDIRLGIRFDDFSQELVNRANNSVSKNADDRISPQLGAVYSLSETLSVYAVYGEGFRALSGSDFAGNTFDPNVSESLEAGVKLAMADGRLTGTASVFRIRQDNILTSDPTNPGFLLAAGEAESEGLEFDLTGQLTEQTSLWLSYTYVDAQTLNSVLDPNFGLVVGEGSPLLNIPEHTLSAQLAHDAVIAGRPIRVGGALLYVDDRLGEVATDFELPAYTLGRLFAELSLTDSLTVRAEIDNVFDETYYTNSFSQLWIQPGMPRNFMMAVNLRF